MFYKMRIKTKLNLGVGLLFLMIIILSLVSGYSVFLIKADTENILKANYNTLEYSRNMILSLDEIQSIYNKQVQGSVPSCGNGLCEIANGENAVNCPADCGITQEFWGNSAE